MLVWATETEEKLGKIALNSLLYTCVDTREKVHLHVYAIVINFARSYICLCCSIPCMFLHLGVHANEWCKGITSDLNHSPQYKLASNGVKMKFIGNQRPAVGQVEVE